MDFMALTNIAIEEHEASQYSSELRAMLKIAHRLDPKIVVEIGTHRSGTAWAVLKVCNPTTYYGIDPNPQGHLEKITYIQGYSNKVSTQIPDSIDLLIIDGDHSHEVANQDWDLYVPKLSKRGILFWCDINTKELWEIWEDRKNEFKETFELIQAEDEAHIGHNAEAREGAPHPWGGIGVGKRRIG